VPKSNTEVGSGTEVVL
jgi:hypothetical protein